MSSGSGEKEFAGCVAQLCPSSTPEYRLLFLFCFSSGQPHQVGWPTPAQPEPAPGLI